MSDDGFDFWDIEGIDINHDGKVSLLEHDWSVEDELSFPNDYGYKKSRLLTIKTLSREETIKRSRLAAIVGRVSFAVSALAILIFAIVYASYWNEEDFELSVFIAIIVSAILFTAVAILLPMFEKKSLAKKLAEMDRLERKKEAKRNKEENK